jgi:hypothetical protein
MPTRWGTSWGTSTWARGEGLRPAWLLASDTSEYQSLLNISSWTVDDFMEHYTGTDVLDVLLSSAARAHQSDAFSRPPEPHAAAHAHDMGADAATQHA